MEHDSRYHYQVIARAIAEIDAAAAPLSLSDLAAKLGLSPAHFQRVFSAWAGVSPKAYQSYLTLDLSKRLLAQSASLQSVSHEVGLSSAGRLHDLFLRWEAMTPGEYAKGGAGLKLASGTFESPFGPVVALGSARGLCGLAFAAEKGERWALDDLARRWPAAQIVQDPALLQPWVKAAFDRKGQITLHLHGAPFQLKVWEALLQIPEGHVRTYGAIAAAIGTPAASRAVGTAIGQNPLSYLIPCHRVLRKDGSLGGYHWGLGVKRQLLAREAARMELP